jgi:putative membrane protein
MMNGGWGAMTPFGWVLMTVLWISVVAVVVWAVARIFPGAPGGTRDQPTARRDEVDRESPEALLDRRLAAGEIDPETYDQIRERLAAARERKEVQR